MNLLDTANITAKIHSGQSGAMPVTCHSGIDVGARPKGIFLLDSESFELIYAEEDRSAIEQFVDIDVKLVSRFNWRAHRELLANVEVIFSGWMAPVMDADFLECVPKLRAVFYGAGSVRYFTSDVFWERGIRVTSAFAANAVPVAEYTVSVAILSLKKFWSYSAAARCGRGWGDHTRPIQGVFRGTIGVVSLGMIGRKVVDMLSVYDVKVLVYCPYLSEDAAAALGVERCSLDDIFKRADVVSVHTPVLKDTIGFIDGKLVGYMKRDATLINTSRGVILNQPEVLDVLRIRPDINVVLDVTNPEPPQANDPLFSLPNVTVTPHIAGSHGRECQRMGSYMVDELKRYLRGEPLRWEVTRESVQRMA